MTGRFAQVALPLPLFEPYRYRIPEALADQVRPGDRVVVPVRRRELVGIVLETGTEAPPSEPRDILAAPDPEPAVTPALLRTAEWMAGYYGAPIGLALRTTLPASLWGRSRILIRSTGGAGARRLGGLAEQLLQWLDRRDGEAPLDLAARHFRKPLWEVADRLRRVSAAELILIPVEPGSGRAVERRLELAGERLTLVERGRKFSRSRRQRELYETLEAIGGGAPLSHLRDNLGFSDAVVRGLVGSGLARTVQVERLRDPFAGIPGSPPPPGLTPEQEDALLEIERLPPGGAALLFGITGSGKTLVYLRAVERALAAGRGAIVLVPEIGLTPQMVSRVRGMFGDQVAVLHSALSDGERADAWRLLRRGERKVAVGARSALFAPVSDLGLIVLDEEHEASYKNGESPRYHAREVARVRAALERARLVLGSATPSLESWALATGPEPPAGEGPEQPAPVRFRLLRLPRRIADRPLPAVELVDLRTAPLVRTGHAVPWSEALDRAVSGALERQEQVMSPQDISDAVVFALSAPPSVQISEIMIRPLQRLNVPGVNVPA